MTTQNSPKSAVTKQVTYAENPNLGYKKVSLADGSTEYKKNCKLIKDNYYRISDQCILVDKRWYMANDPRIFYDCEINEYALISFKGVNEGVVGTSESGELIIGKFSSNPLYNCKLVTSKYVNGIACISYEIPKALGFVEHINKGLWSNMKNVEQLDIRKLANANIPLSVQGRLSAAYNVKLDMTTKKAFDFSNNAYNAEESKEFDKKISEYNKFKTPLTKDVKRAARLLGDLTFGCEIETKLGNIPGYLQSQMGIIICKDGSIGYSPEFVTVPYKGAKGLQSLKNLFTELNRRCTTDVTCSLHYHVGSIRKDREFLIAIYKLYCNIQAELHAMLPMYKTNPEGIKKKNYCNFLPSSLIGSMLTQPCNKELYKSNINQTFAKIHNWVLGGVSSDKLYNRKTKTHPRGRQKWYFESRYFSMNIINMFVSDRQTVEFRAECNPLA